MVLRKNCVKGFLRNLVGYFRPVSAGCHVPQKYRHLLQVPSDRTCFTGCDSLKTCFQCKRQHPTPLCSKLRASGKGNTSPNVQSVQAPIPRKTTPWRDSVISILSLLFWVSKLSTTRHNTSSNKGKKWKNCPPQLLSTPN